jgi:hypothetical protein
VERAVTGILKAADENYPVEDRAPDRTTTFIYRQTSEQVSAHIKKSLFIFKEKGEQEGQGLKDFSFSSPKL